MSVQKHSMSDQEIHEAAKKVVFSELRTIRDFSPVTVQEILDQNLDDDTVDHLLHAVSTIANELDIQLHDMDLDTCD